MAFDAGMLACVLSELRKIALGARVEKVFQPERDEIVLQMRSFEGGRRLLINAGSSCPRIGFTETQKENPYLKMTAYTQSGLKADFNIVFLNHAYD